MSSLIKPERVRVLKELPHREGIVAYWMSRDQRVNDNWALLFAQSLAIKYRSPLAVVFCLAPKFLEATIRHYGMMLKGLKQIESALDEKQLPFFLLLGSPKIEITNFVKKYNVTKLVTDFNPLTINRKWKDDVIKKVNASVYEVDAHNIIPCWITSQKQEFGAYTIRPKIHKLLPEYLEDFPALRTHPIEWGSSVQKIDWEKADTSLKINRTVGEVSQFFSGEKFARAALKNFLEHRLQNYDAQRNDPLKNAQSNLSPYLHFGQISAQRIALQIVQQSKKSIQQIIGRKKNGSAQNRGNEEAFLEELIVRRELSDNFTHYNHSYNSFDGFPEWAKKTLNEHRADKRDYVYSLEQFEQCSTHDNLWNAAQMQMAVSGKMHGYMRMYWAKKILEWTSTPEEALAITTYLNDKYELDGRDPNGYAGIAWSIGGVHDRAWFERPVYGKIRYMNYNGCASKFDVKKYISENLLK